MEYIYEEIINLAKLSKPIEVENLGLDKIDCDLAFGSFSFYFNEKCINLYPYTSDITLVLEFLENLIYEVPLCITVIEDEGLLGVFYAQLIDKNQIHFLVAEDYNNRTWNIIYNVIINRNTLIKDFYNQLYPLLKDWRLVKVLPYGNNLEPCEKYLQIITDYINQFKKIKEFYYDYIESTSVRKKNIKFKKIY